MDKEDVPPLKVPLCLVPLLSLARSAHTFLTSSYVGEFGLIWDLVVASTHQLTDGSQHLVGPFLSRELVDPQRPLFRHVSHLKQGDLELHRREPESTHNNRQIQEPAC